jgi:hypothetical protein
MGAADALRRGFRQPEVADLALLHQPRHRAHRFLHRDGGVDAVLVVEVDHLDAEPPQAVLAGLHDVFGPAVHAVAATLAPHLPEFGSDQNLVAAALDGAADHLLAAAPAIHVGQVEVVDAAIQRVADQPFRLGVIRIAIDPGHRHAAEADGGGHGAIRAEPALLGVFRIGHQAGPSGGSRRGGVKPIPASARIAAGPASRASNASAAAPSRSAAAE